MSNYPLANVHPEAVIGSNVVIEPFATIQKDVVIGDGCWIGPNAVICEGARLGKNVKVFPGASVSSIPQDLKFAGEKTETFVGDNTVIRESVTISRGTVDKHKTVIGKNCLLMAYVHIAHDCQLGSHTIIANAVQLGGHVHVGDWAFLGGLSGVHQFVRVGAHAMTGFQTRLSQDLPPYVTASGNPAQAQGINQEGLKRRGFDAQRIDVIKQLHRLLYRSQLRLEEAVQRMAQLRGANAPGDADVVLMLDFLAAATRGIVR